jgi:hypothetical protein
VFESSEEENDDYSSGKLEENEEGCDDNNWLDSDSWIIIIF